MEKNACEIEDCLSDEALTPQQRRMLAIALRWHRVQLDSLKDDHETTDRKIDQHLVEAREIQARLRQLHIAVWGDESDPDRKQTGLVGLRNQVCAIARVGAAAAAALGAMLAWLIHVVSELGKLYGIP